MLDIGIEHGYQTCFLANEYGLFVVGCDILESETAPDAWKWWEEYTANDPHCKAHPESEAKIILQDAKRWLTYDYIIARKPD